MPIIEIAIADSPLAQGDVLSGIPLFRTDAATQQPASSKATLCLVLSRPCVVAHKPTITVAAIEKYAHSVPKDVESFEDMLDFLTDMRDGLETPDVFYLGNLTGHDGWFAARLEQIHCINLPIEKDRAQFINAHRIATLAIDFRRDLHLRLFRSFASLGFDDIGWLADKDLTSLLVYADADIAKAKADVARFKSEIEKQQRQSQQFSTKALDKAIESLSTLEAQIAPYRKEDARRIRY